MVLIGSHVSMSGKEMLFGSVKEALSYGANVFMVYTGAPQNTRRKDIEAFMIDKAYELISQSDIEYFTIHAPYIVNLANTTKQGYHDFAIEFLKSEVERAQALGAHQMTLHPGSHVGAGEDIGIQQIIHGLNQVIEPKQTVHISLETMAGKGTELGKSFEQIAEIISGVTHSEKLSVTFDSCHVYDTGYDIVTDLDGVLNEFDKIIGLDRLGVIHINDSKFGLGSHKDRHANIGQGTIGFETIHKLVHHPQLSHLPKILETPWIPVEEGSKTKIAPYEAEIAMIKEGQYNPQFIEKLIQQNQN